MMTVSYFIKCFLNVKADKLKGLVVFVGFFNEMCGQDGWFLYAFLWHEAMLMRANEFGEHLGESSG